MRLMRCNGMRWNDDAANDPDGIPKHMAARLIDIVREPDFPEILRTVMNLIDSETPTNGTPPGPRVRKRKRDADVAPQTTTTTTAPTPTSTPTTPRVPLRTVYWFVTNYAKKHAVAVAMRDGTVASIYNSYQDWIYRYNRSMFDVYRRGKMRVYFEWPGAADAQPQPQLQWTTIAQLNFAAWAYRTNVLESIRRNFAAVQNDRVASRIQRRIDKAAAAAGLSTGTGGANGTPRHILSQAPIQQCCVMPAVAQSCTVFALA